MRKLIILIVLLSISKSIFAQKNGSISGTLLDSGNHKITLNYATVSVYKAGDSMLTNYKLSDDKGIFKITNLPVGVKYKIVVTAWQYNNYRKEVELTSEKPVVDLGQLYLNTKSNDLEEVNIVSERPPVLVRKDTIEFNAESFKTLPSAVVEDLLKKLPGVAVAADGSIQVNGKAVSKILVDGKEFFGGDQQIATKNLPANIIDKIQVVDDKEATRRDPDILAGNIPQVINLKLKKAIKKGAFGKLYGGAGLKELYEAGGIMNFFRDTTQVSILAYGNNVNKPGFSIGDVARIGGFSRSGINSISIQQDGRFELNNISFGGSSSGIQKSAGAGANFNTLTKGGLKINGKYFYGQNDNLLNMLIAADQTLGSEKLITNNENNSRNKSFNHNIGARAEWKIDSLTELTLEPTVTINQIRNLLSQQISSRNGINQILNNTKSNSTTRGDNTEYLLVANLWKDFKKAGRSFNTSINLTKRVNLNDEFNNSNSNYFFPVSGTAIDQLRNNNIRNQSAYFSANYSEPISKKLSFNIVSNGNYIDNDNALYTFYKNPLNQAYDIGIANLSETVSQSGFKSLTRASLKWKATKNLNIQPGLVWNTIDLNNQFINYPSFEQHFQFFAPSLTIRYKDLNVSYSPSFQEPDVRYIQPVANNTNPLFVQNGNAALRPSRTYRVLVNLYKYDTKRSLNFSANASGSRMDDGIVMSRIISNEGVQVSTPINVSGIWTFNGNGNISKDFKNAKKQFTIGTGFSTNYTRNIVLVNNVNSYAKIFSLIPSINSRINLNDKFELGERYSLSINNSRYENSFYRNLNYQIHTSETDLVLRLPKKIVWESNYRIQYNTQKTAGYDNSVQLWNAGVTYLFMKNDRAQLKFSVNDILNANIRRSVNISGNTITDTQYNNLGRYGMLTFTYNIQNFGGKVGGRETFFRF